MLAQLLSYGMDKEWPDEVGRYGEHYYKDLAWTDRLVKQPCGNTSQ
jgi:hypothetical protein